MVILTLIAAFLSPVFARWKVEISGYLALFITGFNFLMAILLAKTVVETGSFSVYMGDWMPPWGIELRINELSMLMLLVITGFSFMIVLYSLGMIKHEITRRVTGWYYTAYMLAVAGMMGMVISHDIFNLYVMLEVVGICSCALVVARGNKESTEAALKYLLLATIGSGFILFAVGMLYMVTGNLNFDYVARELVAVKAHSPSLLWASVSFFVVGFGLKSALFPLHLWLPDAHSAAPSPSSALLSSLVVKVYVVALWKLLYRVYGVEFLWETMLPVFLLILSSLAILVGSFFAYTQIDIKRRLAYSTVAQIGYIFLGFSFGTSWGIMAAVFHIVLHAFMKASLFMAAGSIYRQTGLKKVTLFYGIGTTMPVTMGAFTVASLSMVGIPFLGGFITKYGLAMGSLEADKGLFIGLVVLSGLLNASYYFPILRQAYFEKPRRSGLALDRIPATTLFSFSVLSMGIIYLGLFPWRAIDFMEKIATSFLN